VYTQQLQKSDFLEIIALLFTWERLFYLALENNLWALPRLFVQICGKQQKNSRKLVKIKTTRRCSRKPVKIEQYKTFLDGGNL
jgi:hypothetical protein